MRTRAVLIVVASMALLSCGTPARASLTAASTPVPSVNAAAVAISTAAPQDETATATATPTPSAPFAAAGPPASVFIAPHDTPRVTVLPRAPGDRTRTVVLDPGHAADESGAAANGVVEKDSNLDMAFRVESLLTQQGVRVVLTRRTDDRAYSGPAIAGYSATRRDLQARIDIADDAAADVFVSLHSNGGPLDARGVETYYNSQRPFSEQNRALATSLQSDVVNEMSASGYPVTNRGVIDDSCLKVFQGRCFALFVLAPPRVTSRDEVLQRGGVPDALGFGAGQTATTSRATEMPAALIESLFVSNPSDAALLRSDDSRDALARGIARGILDYLTQSGH